MKVFKLLYYIFLAFTGLVAILLIGSVFPVTGNYKLMVVQSGSMEPGIKMGSIVMIKPAEDYKVGDVISFTNPERRKESITHRMVGIEVVEGKISYITKGDANEEPDSRKVPKSEVLGKVLLHVSYLGYAVNYAKKPVGFGLIVIVPAAAIIFDEAKNIFEEVKRIRTKKKVSIE